MLPIQDEFRQTVKDFITDLRKSNFKVLENPMSTQVYGEFNEVMTYLTNAIETTFNNTEHVMVNLKIVKSDRSNYEPSF